MKAPSNTPAFLFDLDGTLVELAGWRIHRCIYQDRLDLLQHLEEVGVRVAA